MSDLHLRINTYADTAVSSSQWTLKGKSEPERVSVRFKDKEYILVLEDSPFFEIWSVDEKGEQDILEQILNPNKETEELTGIIQAFGDSLKERINDIS